MRYSPLALLLLALTACQTAVPPEGRNNRSPDALFTMSATSGPAPLGIAFDASASHDEDGSIAAYRWDFGDGAPAASGVTTSHTFTKAGVFTVVLTVTDNQGATSSAQQTVQATQAGGNLPPVASFSSSTTSGEAPLDVSFDAGASNDPDGTIASYSWDFGDGTSGSGVVVSHTFSEGVFDVSLSVVDDAGATARQTITITATAPGTPPPGTPPPQNDVATLQKAWDASVIASGAASELSNLAVDVALTATLRAGSQQLVVSGTLRESSPGIFDYESSPPDRLRFVRANGAQMEFVFSRLQGDFSNDGAQFISNDHSVAMLVTSNELAGSIDIAMESNRLPQPGSSVRDIYQRLKGTFTDAGGIVWTTDAQIVGTSYYDVDSQRLESTETISGNLAATSIDFSMTLDGSEVYKLLGQVENIRRRYAHSWQFGDGSYQLDNVEIFIALRNNTPVDLDQWIITGTLLRDGVPIGHVAQDTSDPSRFQIALFIGTEKVTLLSISIL